MGVDALKMFASLAAAVVGPAVGWLSSRNDQGLLNAIKVLDAIPSECVEERNMLVRSLTAKAMANVKFGRFFELANFALVSVLTMALVMIGASFLIYAVGYLDGGMPLEKVEKLLPIAFSGITDVLILFVVMLLITEAACSFLAIFYERCLRKNTQGDKPDNSRLGHLLNMLRQKINSQVEQKRRID